MEPLVQISDGDASDLTPSNLCIEHRGLKIEIRGTVERKLTLADVPLVLGGIVRDRHVLLYMQFSRKGGGLIPYGESI